MEARKLGRRQQHNEREAGDEEDEQLGKRASFQPEPETLMLDKLHHGKDDDHSEQRHRALNVTWTATAKNQPEKDPPDRENHQELCQCNQPDNANR